MTNFIPTKEEEKKVKEVVKSVLNKIKIKDAKPILGGSGAKKTWLSNANDLDIYVKFNYSKYKDKSDSLSKYLERGIKKKFKITKLHGSRDYFQTTVEGYTVELVPILDIRRSSQAKNITDISQLHVNYVRRYPKLNNEIRKAKMFCKAQGVYGAESFIKGFSGYVLECLTIKYRGFNNLTKNASKWKSKTEIGKKRDLALLNQSKKSPLILIDPVQDIRNAAAALSKERYNSFIKACKAYSKSKNKDSFFKIKEFDIKKIKSPVILKVTPKTGKRDVVGAKLMKAFEFIKKQSTLKDFKIKNSGWHWNEKREAYFWFTPQKEKLPPSIELQGPKTKDPINVKRFKKKHKKCFTKKDRIYAKEKRKFYKFKDLITDLLKSKEVKSRTSKISL